MELATLSFFVLSNRSDVLLSPSSDDLIGLKERAEKIVKEMQAECKRRVILNPNVCIENLTCIIITGSDALSFTEE